jgi:hypothetical protein
MQIYTIIRIIRAISVALIIKYPCWYSIRFLRGRWWWWWWGSYVTCQQGHVALLYYKATMPENASVNTPQGSGVHTIADCKKQVTRVHFVASLYVENTVTYLALRYQITALIWQGIKGKKKLVLWRHLNVCSCPSGYEDFDIVYSVHWD